MENLKNTIEAKWSGAYPARCCGTWTLTVNGKNETDKIPKELINSPMETYGTYRSFSFDDDGCDEWEEYEDGLKEDEWIEKNKEWLAKISASEDVQKEIYRAFANADWRHSSCGGCIY